MKLTININMDNAAFDCEDLPQYELARILKNLANLSQYANSVKELNGAAIKDINGNHVGVVKVSGR